MALTWMENNGVAERKVIIKTKQTVTAFKLTNMPSSSQKSTAA